MGTRKRGLEPLWNLNSFYLPPSLQGSVCTTVPRCSRLLGAAEKSGGGEESEWGRAMWIPRELTLGYQLTLRSEMISLGLANLCLHQYKHRNITRISRLGYTNSLFSETRASLTSESPSFLHPVTLCSLLSGRLLGLLSPTLLLTLPSPSLSPPCWLPNLLTVVIRYTILKSREKMLILG